MTLASWVHTVFRRDVRDQSRTSNPGDENDPANELSRESLFGCPSWETIHFAREMGRYSRCDVVVEQVQYLPPQPTPMN